jgi:RNA polymerase sigma-70 factor (ECF subfamily)
MNEPDLTRLAGRYKKGDRGAFRILVESLTRTLIALGYRFTQDWETARDLTQETWLKVHRSIAGYDPDKPFRKWLYTVHRNTCVSYVRSAAVRRETPMAEEALAALETAKDHDDAQAMIERREFFGQLSKALEELSDSQRTVFIKVDVEQVGQREAAEILKMSFNTLRTTLHFARRRLAGILRSLEETP